MAHQSLTRQTAISVALLAAAVLLLQGTLLRLLAVAQFYHFAFLVVSLALLGFGASGTLLSLSPRLQAMPLERLLAAVGALFALSVAVSYVVTRLLPFDSYSIAWERRQLLFFVLYYLAISLPFLAGGLGIGASLSRAGLASHRIYAANLLGSAGGALLAPLTLALAGVPGGLLASPALPLLLAWRGRWRGIVATALALALAVFAGLTWLNLQGRAPLGLAISPYKGLAHALRYPGSQRVFAAWNAFARVDVVADAGTRQLPGLSYAYPDAPPPQLGLAVDAAGIQPITQVSPDQFAAAAYLPEAIAFELRPAARALALEPAGGLGVLQALAGGAAEVTAVLDNPLERRAVATVAPQWDVYADPRVRTAAGPSRFFAQRDRGRYDVVLLPLTDGYQPVASGAYSLAETYNLTVEAFTDLLDRLKPEGILVASRWLQTPPSEESRLLATVVEALERRGIERPQDALVALRGIQTMTVLAQPAGWTAGELTQLRAFAQERRFDLVWAPDVQPEETNRFNRLPQSIYYETARDLFDAGERRAFYAASDFAIAPATDSRPFFFHFFTWRQTPEVLATLGRTWQPFGGSGYFVLVAMLALVLALSAVLIVLPLALPGRGREALRTGAGTPRLRVLLYFGLLGLGFLLVEIPLIQQWILLVGQPTYAFAAVISVLLVFSSLGSLSARAVWLPRRAVFPVLVALAVATPFVLAWLTRHTLGWPLLLRAGLAALSLAPLAFVMGLPFPLGLAWLERRGPVLIPWAWAINGCASVVAGVLAAMAALSYGFSAVLLAGAVCYAGAWLVWRPQPPADPVARPER
jgi:hypothetical protein